MADYKAVRRRCQSVSRISAKSLLSWLALSATLQTSLGSEARHRAELPLLPVIPPTPETPYTPVVPAQHEFTLRHVFHRGTSDHPDLHRRLDVRAGSRAYEHAPAADEGIYADIGPFTASSHGLDIQRLQDRRIERILGMEGHAREGGYRPQLPESDWILDEVAGPNITDKETIVTLAKMAACAYNQGPDDPDWENVRHGFNSSLDFGWQSDGLRGHVFADKTNDTIVLSIKGTSKAVWDGAETTTNDKVNDNLFFGCCCGTNAGTTVREVCGCSDPYAAYSCNSTCLTQELKQQNKYWRASIDLYDNVTALYPNATSFWITGHSLGGAVSALLGLTVGQPVVSFEAPGDVLPAKRLGLPAPPGTDPHRPQKRSNTGAFHFGHNADPVFTGTCNGFGASCVWGGYALESQCHTGMRCEYDAQGELGWRNIMTNHGIKTCIRNVYEVMDAPPKCEPDTECEDACNLKWNYFESNGSEITTTRSTTSATSTTLSLTRTETCKTPGWWGCLDESSTTSSTTTVTSTLTTATCHSYGWFGHCLDPITTTATVTTTLVTATAPASTSVTTTTSAPTETCTSIGWFGRCLDPGISPPSASTAGSTLAASRITPAPEANPELR